MEGLAASTRQEKEIKGLQIGREKVKLSLLVNDTILYIEDPENTNKSLLELMNGFSKFQDTILI